MIGDGEGSGFGWGDLGVIVGFLLLALSLFVGAR